MEFQPIHSRFGEKVKISLTREEAYLFMVAGMPGSIFRSSLLRNQLDLSAEGDEPLTVALPTGRLPRSEENLSREADRFERLFKNIPIVERPVYATPEGLANMRCMSAAIGEYLEHRVGALAMENDAPAIQAHA